MSQRVQLYEAMYILDSSFEDEEIAAIEERIKAGIESTGGQFESVHEFARRRLAYEIKGHRDGIYRVMSFTGTGETVDELKREFNLAEDIVRGTVLVANPKYVVGKKVAEEAPVAELFAHPRHPYTQGLIRSIPRIDLAATHKQRLEAIAGTVPKLVAPPEGCRFAPRCRYAMAACTAATPALRTVAAGHKVACILQDAPA